MLILPRLNLQLWTPNVLIQWNNYNNEKCRDWDRPMKEEPRKKKDVVRRNWERIILHSHASSFSQWRSLWRKRGGRRVRKRDLKREAEVILMGEWANRFGQLFRSQKRWENRFIPRASRKNAALTTLGFLPSKEPCWTFDLNNHKVINFCSFKPLVLWYMLQQQYETNASIKCLVKFKPWIFWNM